MFSNIYYVMDSPDYVPGLFSHFQSVIGFLNFCETECPLGFKVSFESGFYYDPDIGPNWWEYYFEPIEFGKIKEDTIIKYVETSFKREWAYEAISTMTKERAYEIINKYIKPKQHIKNKIDEFYKLNFSNYTIGVHYRGTDKIMEAPRVSFDMIRDELKKNISDLNSYKIFIATDEQEFLNYMISQFGDNVIYTNSIRSTNGDPIHHKVNEPITPLKENMYRLGEEAVIDCYLLSKTNILIKTDSNLSSSAININPTIPVISLNNSYYGKLR